MESAVRVGDLVLFRLEINLHKIKIDNFLKDYPDKCFPEFSTFDEKAALQALDRIHERFFPSISNDGLSLVKAMRLKAVVCRARSQVGDDFRLLNFINSCKIQTEEFVCINWHRFDKIDKIRLNDLDSFFYDVWYPDVDDIDIFDNSYNWVISIYHDGSIKVLR